MVVQSGIAIVEQVPLRPILKWAGGVSGQFKMDIKRGCGRKLGLNDSVVRNY